MDPLLQSALAHVTRGSLRILWHLQKIDRSVWRHSSEHHQSSSGTTSTAAQSRWNHVPKWHISLEHRIIATSGLSANHRNKSIAVHTIRITEGINSNSVTFKSGLKVIALNAECVRCKLIYLCRKCTILQLHSCRPQCTLLHQSLASRMVATKLRWRRGAPDRQGCNRTDW